MTLLWKIPRVAAHVEAHKKIVAVVLGVWWVFGVGFLTFGGPFATPNNGYFAAWAAAICSWLVAWDAADGLMGDDDADSQDGEDYIAAAAEAQAVAAGNPGEDGKV